MKRREFLAGSAGAAGTLAAGRGDAYASIVATEPEMPRRSNRKYVPIAIASENGLEGTRLAVEKLKAGVDTLEAAVACVTLVENDPDDTSVGYGGLPNENGTVELDAAVMHGPSHQVGAVAAIRGIRNPAKVALQVLRRSDHDLLVGEGATAFARAHGFREENLLTDKARRIWLHWKETLSGRDDWLPPAGEELHSDVIKFFKIAAKEPHGRTKGPRQGTLARTGPDYQRPTGTVHCAAQNARGDISCTTSTSGLAFKIPGRVGDSPLPGAGLYVDNEIGSCGSTGRGEANIENLCCFAAVELMRGGAKPEEAGMEVLGRIAAHTPRRLKDKRGRPAFGLKFYLLAKNGQHAGCSLWGPARYAVTDAKGTRLETCRHLYRRPK